MVVKSLHFSPCFVLVFQKESATMAELVEAEELGEGGMSKNALKKQQKAEEAAKKKAEKDAEKAAKAALEPKKEKVGVAEEVEELDPTKYYENRLSAINQMEVNEDDSTHFLVLFLNVSLIVSFVCHCYRHLARQHSHINSMCPFVCQNL